MSIGLIVLVVVVFLAIIVIVTYNGFVKKDNDVQEAFATMDVYLKKRFDLIPNLVETVKGYAKHESETLEKVVEARSAVSKSTTTNEKVANENILSGTLKSLFAIAESYPDLKANENFKSLMSQLEKIEEDIANSRKYYNAVVKKFNIACQSFPSSIIAGLFHYSKKELFAAPEEERENVKVEF